MIPSFFNWWTDQFESYVPKDAILTKIKQQSECKVQYVIKILIEALDHNHYEKVQAHNLLKYKNKTETLQIPNKKR